MHPVTQTLAELFNQMDRARFTSARRHDLSAAELSALVAIRVTEGARPVELASRLGMTTGSVTALIDRLEARGLATREPYPYDRRSLQVVATTAGEEVVADAGRVFDGVVVGVFAQFSTAVAATTDVLLRSLSEGLSISTADQAKACVTA
jgi:DNA-binding MarR family transcriptional regulator